MDSIQLSQIYDRKKNDRDIFQELMPFKVNEVLLVANYYDAYNIEGEGEFFERIFGEYLQLNLYAAPRITSVSSEEHTMEILQEKTFQVAIIMAGLDKDLPMKLVEKIKEIAPELPVILLVNNNSDLQYFKGVSAENKLIERVFVWNGDSKIFLAITKYIEDKTNVAWDTHFGNVRVILLVEDSVRYYSRYLPMLYSIVMQQTQEIMKESDTDELQKILQMRARPKVLLCTTFEEAKLVVDQYHEFLLTVISDVKFSKDGIPTIDAGMQLLDYVQELSNIPCLLQSTNLSNKEKAGINDFIHKESETLAYEISTFMKTRLGFGDFIFKGSRGQEIAKASNLVEFEACIATVSPESLIYHSRRHSFSTWLMARGQITLAKLLKPYSVSDFESTLALRKTILGVFESVRVQKQKGRVINFNSRIAKSNRFISRIGKGSLGGKGRGLAFISNFIENINFENILPEINVVIPMTVIIGAEEYDLFVEENHLYERVEGALSKSEEKGIREVFVEGVFSDKLRDQLKELIEIIDRPLAVRSSGLFEDSLLQPFAGVYSTYLIPNNHKDPEVRLQQLEYVVKLVYSSIFSKDSMNYFDAISYKLEEEKMAVIIQELVGDKNHKSYYTQISGVGHSFNYYPFSYMKPEDGFAVLAVGLGMYVVGGEQAYRFCPVYPKLEIKDMKSQIKDNQNFFYALDLNNQDLDCLLYDESANIIKLPLKEAEEDGNLKYCAQIYDYINDRLSFDFKLKGPRVVNFANILKHNSIPLASSLNILLNCFSQAMGSPVEMEFALSTSNANNGLPSLYILQIKPLIQHTFEEEVDIDGYKDDSSVLFKGDNGMGNGILNHMHDIVVMDTSVFDKTKTEEMALEIAQINEQMEREKREYILIGPGRWGTRDRFTGIPVVWSQISNAKVIIEIGLENFPLEASLGSHFFHNVTSMNVGYFSVPYGSSSTCLYSDRLYEGEMHINTFKYFKIVTFANPLSVLMDGRKRKAIIIKNKSSNGIS